jgi:Cytochrome oxidase maturation protein cbb3-type
MAPSTPTGGVSGRSSAVPIPTQPSHDQTKTMRSGQYEDIDGAALRILPDDDLKD